MGEVSRGEEPPPPFLEIPDKGKGLATEPSHFSGMGGVGLSESEKKNGGEGQKPSHCLPKTKAIPKLQIKSERFRDNVQYLKDHALIGKFVGIWPYKKNMVWWINNTWKPQGHYDLQLGVKSFFMVIFFKRKTNLGSSMEGHISSIRQDSICTHGKNVSNQIRKTSR